MKKKPFEISKENFFDRFLNNETQFKIWEEETNDEDISDFLSPLDFEYQLGREETGRYHFAIITPVSEKLVGISLKDSKTTSIPWEIIRGEIHNNIEYIVFKGWGDPLSGENISQFEGVEIMTWIGNIRLMFAKLNKNNPNYFNLERVNKIIGLESLNLF